MSKQSLSVLSLLAIVLGSVSSTVGSPLARRPIIIPSSSAELERAARQTRDRIPPGPVSRAFTGTLEWRFLGPMPILNEGWSAGNDASGRTTAIIVHPTDPNTVYIGGAQGGVWKSTDGGVNWTPLTDFLSSLATGTLAFDPQDPSTIYYGTGEQHYSGDSYYGDGLFKTTDGGTTWDKIAPKTTVGSYIARVAVHPANSSILHLASDRGYLQSTDGGSTWNVRLSGYWCTDLAVSPGVPSNVFAGMNGGGVYLSTDNGTTWAHLTTGLPTSDIGRINLAISPTVPNLVYASYVSSSTGGLLGMYKTTNFGLSWTYLPNTPNYLGGQGWYDNCLIIDPADTSICYAGGVFPYGAGYYGVIRTTNGGTSWDDITIALDGSQVHPDQHTMAIGSDGMLWIGNDGGVWKTNAPGQTWVDCNHTLGLTQFYNLALHPRDSTQILGGNQDNGTVGYLGFVEWPQVTGGDGGPCLFEWHSPDIFYTTYVNMTYLDKWQYDPLIQSWTWLGDVTGPWANAHDRASWCNGPLITDPHQPNTLLAGTYRVWRTTNSGASWDSISGDLTGGGWNALLSLTVAPSGSDTIYSGSSSGLVYLTMDGGTSWTLRNTGLPGADIPDLVADPSDWQSVYACEDRATGSRVFHTTNAGLAWTDITGDLPANLRAQSLAVDFAGTGPSFYVGTDYGVYSSTNGGLNWTKEATNLPNLAVYDLGVDTANGHLVAASHGRGMWRARLPRPARIVTQPETLAYVDSLYTYAVGVTGSPAPLFSLLTAPAGMSIDSLSGFLSWTPDSAHLGDTVVSVVATNTVGADTQTYMLHVRFRTGVGDLRDIAPASGLYLHRAFPNPFRSGAIIEFGLGRPGLVTLEIYDVTGKRVRALLNERRPVGLQSARWDGRGDRGERVAAGVYFYAIRAGTETTRGRVILVR